MMVHAEDETEARKKAKSPLIPYPQKVSWEKGDFSLKRVTIQAEKGLEKEADRLVKYLTAAGSKPKLVQSKGKIALKIGTVAGCDKKEGYALDVAPGMIRLTAPTNAGVFYGMQTIRQLIREKDGVVSGCTITDWPDLELRGFMHDVGRNYIPPAELKEHLEVMAQYKYNVFHMHMADNPGWRLESKLHPQVNAPETMTRKKGKIYTQKEFKDLVQFCRDRHMTLIPELDIPGHTLAFRKAFKVKSMREERVTGILVDLFEELCDLVPAEDMPYIHLGTDEAWHPEEKVDPNKFLPPIYKAIRAKGREIIGWMQGYVVKGDTDTINQLWARYKPAPGHRLIDSRCNYVNHLDAFVGIQRMYFQKPGWGVDRKLLLGGILCTWPDNRIDQDRGALKQNPIYSCMVAYSEAVWTGVEKNQSQYWARIPNPSTPEFAAYEEFESRLLSHRDRFFEGKEFHYVKQTHIPWKLLQLKPTKQKADTQAQLESLLRKNRIRERYSINDHELTWTPETYRGATLQLTHFFGFSAIFKKQAGIVYALSYIHSPKKQTVGFWIGFHDWSRSGGRRGGPTAKLGQWHKSNPKIWINNNEIAPPEWKQPGLAEKTPEIPWVDENYYYRPPTQVALKKGWNQVLLKVPSYNTWKWMFTCVPVKVDGVNVREVEGLKFSTETNVTPQGVVP